MVLGSSYTIRRQLVGIEALDKDEKSGDPFLPLWSCMATVEEMEEVKTKLLSRSLKKGQPTSSIMENICKKGFKSTISRKPCR